MDLIVNEVVEFEEVHNADRNGVVELLAGASVVKSDLAVISEEMDLGLVEFNAVLLSLCLCLFDGAAVVGSLAGLWYGMEQIPEPWLQQLAKHDWICRLCDQFADAICSK